MTPQRNNFYTIAAGHPFNEAGIPVQTGVEVGQQSGYWKVLLSNECYVVVEHRAGMVPYMSSGVLLFGDLTEVRMGPKVYPRFSRADNTKAIIIRIKISLLVFNFPKVADGLFLWPGGDGDIRPFRQYGRTDDNDRDQLFRLMPGETMFAIDNRHAVARLENRDGQLVFTQITEEEVPELIEFFYTRAKRENKPTACTWAARNLEAIMAGYPSLETEISPMIGEINRLKGELDKARRR